MGVEEDIKEILQRLTTVEVELCNHLKSVTAKGETAIKYKIAFISTATALGIWILSRLFL